METVSFMLAISLFLNFCYGIEHLNKLYKEYKNKKNN